MVFYRLEQTILSLATSRNFGPWALYTRCLAGDKSRTVQNQGMLTHSAQDFFKADYFFCEGLGDDWLEKCVSDLSQLNNTRLTSCVNRLTVKGLIVRVPVAR